MTEQTKYLEVRKKYQDYLVWLFGKINNFPRKQKFLLGERIGNLALDIQQDIIRIQYSSVEQRKLLLRQFNLELEVFRQLMRLAWQMSFLSKKSFLWQEVKIDEVGRMTHGLATRFSNQR